MRKVVTRLLGTLFVCAVGMTLGTRPGLADEGYFFQGQAGFSRNFPLMGGTYSLYVRATRPVTVADEASKACLFFGNFERISPTADTLRLGPGIPIETIVPYKINPTLTMPGGVYRLYVTSLSNCDWVFSIVSKPESPSGLGAVQMLLADGDSATTSLSDKPQFYAQYRVAGNADVPVSGTLDLIHDGRVVRSFPLLVGSDTVSKASVVYQNLQWDDSEKFLGANVMRFMVKIGSEVFSGSKQFTLTR